MMFETSPKDDYRCVKTFTLEANPMDHDTEIEASTMIVDYRVFWSGPGHDIEWEPIKYRLYIPGGSTVTSTDFRGFHGLYFKGWCAKHFEIQRAVIENEDPEFDAYRTHAFEQHREAVSDHRYAVL